MRGRGAIVASVALALLAAGCDPLERRYVDEGAGVNLYLGNGDNQIALLKEYIAFVCAQVGPDQSCVGGDWTTFVHAGMNDIDQRCDGYLTWLDARRRDKEPVLSQLGALGAAVHSIMTVTGSDPKALNIAASAFGLAIASYTNWNSRVLISLEKSTIQEVVYNSQGKFREKINGKPVPDMPAAIYLLRNYLRLCMPITIEATFNTSTILVQRDPAAAARAASQGNSVVKNLTAPTRINFVAPKSEDALRIRAYYESGLENGKQVRDWIRNNWGAGGWPRFISSGDVAAFRRLITALNIP
jgi:hypothetical protein